MTAGGGGTCRDQSTNCRSWASRGECNRNPAYMHVNCKLSCNKCSTTKKVTSKRCFTLPPPKTTTTDLVPPLPEITTTQIVPPIPPTEAPTMPPTGEPPIPPPTPDDCKATEKYGKN